MSVTKEILIKRLQDIGVIHHESVILTSGKASNFYCDLKRAYGEPEILDALADMVQKRLSDSCTCLVATGYGGLPLAAVVAAKSGKKFTAVRGTEKKHGKGGMIDGYTPRKEDRIVIIDDVLTTGSSIRKVLDTLTTATVVETKNVSAIVVVKRGDPELPIPYSYIFSIDEIKHI